MNKKRIYILHKWAGLTLGTILFLLALSGVTITFRHELLPIVYSSLFHVVPEGEVLPLKQVLINSKEYLGPERSMTNLYPSEDKDEAHLILFKDPKRSFPGLITVNPYSGAVIKEMGMIQNFFAVMLFMHSNLFLGKLGAKLVGIFGVILVFFVISGIYIWAPKHQLLHRLKKILHLNKINPTQRLHHFLGLTFSLPLLISAVTGFLIIFDVAYTVSRALNHDRPRVEELERVAPCSFEQQLESLNFITPDILPNLISIHLCTQKNSLVKISYGLKDQNFLNGYGRLIVDPVNQVILQKFDSETDPQSWNSKRLTIYPIHTGEYLGLTGRIIVLISGLGLMGLYITGLLLYFKRRKSRHL